MLIFCYFNLPLLTQTLCIKLIYSWNFMCTAKEAVILLLSWSTLYVAFSKCIVYWFYISHLDLPLITQNASEKAIFLLNWRCSAKETVILLLSWSARYIVFSKCIVSWIFGFATIHRRCFCNSQLFFKFYLLRKRSSNISSFMEHPVYSNFRMYSFLILFFQILICHYLLKVYA